MNRVIEFLFAIFDLFKNPKNDTFAKNRCSRTIFGVFLGKNNKRETGKQFPLFPYLQQELFPCFPVSLAKSKMLFPCFLVSRETGKQGNKQGNRETGKQKFGTLILKDCFLDKLATSPP